MDFGIMPLWELRETISAFWRDGDFGHELRLACFAWKLRTGDDFTVGELND